MTKAAKNTKCGHRKAETEVRTVGHAEDGTAIRERVTTGMGLKARARHRALYQGDNAAAAWLDNKGAA